MVDKKGSSNHPIKKMEIKNNPRKNHRIRSFVVLSCMNSPARARLAEKSVYFQHSKNFYLLRNAPAIKYRTISYTTTGV
jgi:hypothetical protein